MTQDEALAKAYQSIEDVIRNWVEENKGSEMFRAGRVPDPTDEDLYTAAISVLAALKGDW